MVFLTSPEWWLLHDCIGSFWQPFTTALVATGRRTCLMCGCAVSGGRASAADQWQEDLVDDLDRTSSGTAWVGTGADETKGRGLILSRSTSHPSVS
jgi:hypothetical protein